MSHMLRMKNRLGDDVLEVLFLNEITLFKFIEILLSKDKLIYIVNSKNLVRNCFALLRVFGFKIVVRIGGMSVGNSSTVQRVVTFFWRILSNRIILVNKSLDRYYLNSVQHKIAFLPGFIRPGKVLLPQVEFDVAFVFAHTPTDIYNEEIILRAIRTYPQYKFLVQCYDVDTSNSYKYLKTRVEQQSDIKISNITFFKPTPSAIENIMKARLYVRPTREDGDSNLIRELCCMKKRVLASDVVSRPKGVLTYPLSDIIQYIPLILERSFDSEDIECIDFFDSHKKLIMSLLDGSH